MEQKNHESLDYALLAIQQEIENPVKNAENPHLRSKYADYNAVRNAVVPIFNKHGLLIKQRTVVQEGVNYLETTVSHPPTKEVESMLTEIVFAKGNAQSQGSGISYARRYALQVIGGTGSDDDDGEKAKGQPLPPQKGKQDKPVRTPIESKLAKCKNLSDLESEFKKLSPDEQKENSKFCSKVKEYIIAEEAKKNK